MKRIEICLIFESAYPVERGGVSNWAHSLISSLQDLEFHICTIVGSRISQSKFPPPPNLKSIRLIPISRKSKDLFQRSWEKILKLYERWAWGEPFLPFLDVIETLLRPLLILEEEIEEIPNADIYHAASPGYAGFLGGLLGERRGKPFLLTCHGDLLFERERELEELPEGTKRACLEFFKELLALSLRRASLVTAVSSHIAERMRDFDPSIEEKLKIVPNGVDVNRFKPKPEGREEGGGEKPFIVGTVSRISPLKDIQTLIKAAALIRGRAFVEFHVIGEIADERYFETCRRLIRDLKVESFLHFDGYNDPLSWYHKFDIFVLPSLSEGMPLSLLEAMSTGLPCIGSDIGGIREVLEGAGRLIPPADPASLASEILLLLSDPELRRELGRRARRRAEELGLERMIAEYRSIYEQLRHERRDASS